MARYLAVAHQTADSPELIDRLRTLASDDSTAELVLLVPATPIQHLLTWVEGEAKAAAGRAADIARGRLEEAGLKVIRASVGDESPILAIEDELREHPAYYDAIVICTFPPGKSRWLGLDLPHQVERRFSLPIIHVVAKAPE